MGKVQGVDLFDAKHKKFYPTLKEGDRIKVKSDSEVYAFRESLRLDGWKIKVIEENGYKYIEVFKDNRCTNS